MQKHSILIAVVIALGLSLLRLHSLSYPLERDEGEYAYMGQLLLEGVPPFQVACNMKMPGVSLAYAVIMAMFGQTSEGIHWGLLCITACISLLIFAIGGKTGNYIVGTAAAAGFSAISLSSSVLGLSANAEYFVLLFALPGILMLLYYLESRRALQLFLSGILLGTCVLMKQHGAVFIICGVVMLGKAEFVNRKWNIRSALLRVFLFLGGIVLPFCLLCIWLSYAGVFKNFWFWVFSYGRNYVSQVPLALGLEHFIEPVHYLFLASPFFWVLALLGLLCQIGATKKAPLNRFFGVFLFVFSSAAIIPGLMFRPHYFILLLPAASLLFGHGVYCCAELIAGRLKLKTGNLFVSFVLITASISILLYKESRLLFNLPPAIVSHMINGENPFPESCVIADSIRKWTKPSDKIAVMGSEPQIFFYAHRRSVTKFIYTYALVEKNPYAPAMQKAMIHDIETGKPVYLIYINVPRSWLVQKGAPRDLLNWYNVYRRHYYQIAGVIDIRGVDRTVYVWGKDAEYYQAVSPYWIAVFKRNDLKN